MSICSSLLLLRLYPCGGGTGGLCWVRRLQVLGALCKELNTRTVNGEQIFFPCKAMRDYKPNTLREVSLGEHSPAPGYHLALSLMVQEKEELLAKG